MSLTLQTEVEKEWRWKAFWKVYFPCLLSLFALFLAHKRYAREHLRSPRTQRAHTHYFPYHSRFRDEETEANRSLMVTSAGSTGGGRLGHPARVVPLPREWGTPCQCHPGMPFSQGQTQNWWDLKLPYSFEALWICKYNQTQDKALKILKEPWKGPAHMHGDPSSSCYLFPWTSVWFFSSWCLSDNRSNVSRLRLRWTK